MKLAVIDLGTNTCNLLIAELADNTYKILYQGKVGVKLGKAGINKKLLTKEAFERACSALKAHRQTIAEFQADKTIAIATSAVRDADNQQEFIDFLLKETGIEITVISGEKEAQLIFQGVLLAFEQVGSESLILDIGGGSNEFIIPNENQMVWKKSFPLGMSRIIEQFSISDPITTDEIEIIRNYFKDGLTDLWKATNGNNFQQLIGCSGAFDTLADLIDQTSPGSKSRIKQEILPNQYKPVIKRIIHSTQKEREQMTGMEPLRVEMIVPSFIFIKLVMEQLKIEKIVQTDFALREGVLYDHIYR